MKVKELIEQLQKEDPDAEAILYEYGHRYHNIEKIIACRIDPYAHDGEYCGENEIITNDVRFLYGVKAVCICRGI